MSKCIVCHINQATVPDRTSVVLRKRLCVKCHRQRLLGDLRVILKAAQEKP